MGAGASAAAETTTTGEEAVRLASAGAREAGDFAEATGEATERLMSQAGGAVADAASSSATEAFGEVGEVAHKAASGTLEATGRLLSLVPEEAVDDAKLLISKVSLSTEELSAAADVLGSGLSKAAETNAVLVALGSAVAQASGMAPAVVEAVGEALCFAGKHLGPISVAAGFLGALVYTFQLSKDQDKNVKTVSLWSASVADWLVLIAVRLDRSAAESTLPLFEGLKTEMEAMHKQVTKHSTKWRLSKMLSSSSFQRDFERAKTSVIELKTALKDFLDQEAIDAQDLQLKAISDAQIDVTNKLDSMDDQLAEIRAMLVASSSSSKSAASTDMDEEEQVYVAMQAAAGVTDTLRFKDFVAAFECFFFAGKDVDKETKRGLRIAIDRDCTGLVTKLDWAKFFRQWKASDLPMEAYVAKLAAEAPPTLCAQVVATGSAAAKSATQQLAAAKTMVQQNEVAAKAAASAHRAASQGAASIGDAFSAKAGSLFGAAAAKKKQPSTDDEGPGVPPEEKIQHDSGLAD